MLWDKSSVGLSHAHTAGLTEALPLCCRFGSGLGSLGLMVVPLLCSIFCGNACVTANSRWAYRVLIRT